LLVMAETAAGSGVADFAAESLSEPASEAASEEAVAPARARRPLTYSEALLEAQERLVDLTSDDLPRRPGDEVYVWNQQLKAFREEVLSGVRPVMEVVLAPGAAAQKSYVVRPRWELAVSGCHIGRYGRAELAAKVPPLPPPAAFLHDESPGVQVQAFGGGRGLERIAGWKRSWRVTSRLFEDRGGLNAGYRCELKVIASKSNALHPVEYSARISTTTDVIAGDIFPRIGCKASFQSSDAAAVAATMRCVAVALHAREALLSGQLESTLHSTLAAAFGEYDSAESVLRVAVVSQTLKSVVLAVKGADFDAHRMTPVPALLVVTVLFHWLPKSHKVIHKYINQTVCDLSPFRFYAQFAAHQGPLHHPQTQRCARRGSPPTTSFPARTRTPHSPGPHWENRPPQDEARAPPTRRSARSFVRSLAPILAPTPH